MKRIYFIFVPCFLLLADRVFSQRVGIGTSNPQNKLHVAGGLRLDTLVGVGGNGLVTHNAVGAVYGLKFTGNINDALRGNGTFGSPSNVWMLNGNAGTDIATNFLGTTDAKPLLFRVNNEPAGILGNANNNLGFGRSALNDLTSGIRNTAIGDYALYSNTAGEENTANGFVALYLNSTGNRNTAYGFGALQSNTAGDENTANGAYALYTNTTGNWNTANGYRALFSNTTGYQNTANGYQVLYSNTSGQQNTANGYQALYSNTTGYQNTANGYRALYSNNTGVYNTAIGYYAGGNFNNAYENVFVGAYSDVNGANYENVIAIGYSAICTSPYQATIGNITTTTYRIYGNWSNISDGNYKKDIREDVPGLAFIKKLRPVTYNLDATRLDNFLHKNISKEDQTNDEAKEIMNKTLKEKEHIRYTGFVAQEVERSAIELGFDFSGIDAPKNKDDIYGLRYAEFVVPLVKAVQEQQLIIEKLQKQV
ncbi:MAG TPA: tail fiber domain-containing protein, partial [Cytophaga sp.]|nr:tail fiber domain-containing protein [Cytophaga sp.]